MSIKILRGETGASISLCKEAIDEANGNLEAAREILSKKLILRGQKRVGNKAQEGIVEYISDGDYNALVRINCETDFVAKCQKMRELYEEIKLHIINKKFTNIEDLKKSTSDTFGKYSGLLGESVHIGAFKSYIGKCYGYIHKAQNIGAMVDCDNNGSNIAIHIAIRNPLSIDIDSLPDKEKIIQTFSEDVSNQNPEIVKKIIEGKLMKYYNENILLEQQYILDDSKKVKDISGNIRMFCRMTTSEESSN